LFTATHICSVQFGYLRTGSRTHYRTHTPAWFHHRCRTPHVTRYVAGLHTHTTHHTLVGLPFWYLRFPVHRITPPQFCPVTLRFCRLPPHTTFTHGLRSPGWLLVTVAYHVRSRLFPTLLRLVLLVSWFVERSRLLVRVPRAIYDTHTHIWFHG